MSEKHIFVNVDGASWAMSEMHGRFSGCQWRLWVFLGITIFSSVDRRQKEREERLHLPARQSMTPFGARLAQTCCRIDCLADCHTLALPLRLPAKVSAPLSALPQWLLYYIFNFPFFISTNSAKVYKKGCYRRKTLRHWKLRLTLMTQISSLNEPERVNVKL